MRKRTTLIAAVGVVLTIIIFITLGRVKDHREYTPQATASAGPYNPSLEVWDRNVCKRQIFPSYDERNDYPWGRLAHQWYCARQWSSEKFADVNQVFDNYKVSTAFSNPEHWAEMKPSPPTNPLKQFFNVFDSSVFLTMSADETSQMREGYDQFPSDETLGSVKQLVDLDRSMTVGTPLPQVYEINDHAPAIHLVTDIGLKTSLRDLIHFSWAQQSGSMDKALEKLRNFGVDLTRSGVDTNIFAFAIAGEEQAFLKTTLVERWLSKGEPLQDLEIVYMHSTTPNLGASLIPDRDGAYDPQASKIWVRAPEMPAIAKEKPSSSETSALAAAAIPASLEHEFYHYLFFRPEVAMSGFILEGEATANGEYLHQLYSGGTVLTTNPEDRLRQLVNQIETSPGTLSERDVQEYEDLLRTYHSHAPLTPQQCRSLETTVSHGNSPIQFERLLSYTPTMFQDIPDVSVAYAQAWAVYHLDLTNPGDRGTFLQKAAAKLHSGQQLDSNDRTKLEQLSAEVLLWAGKLYGELGQKCGH